MNISKYYWDLNAQALKETKKILKNPEHPKFSMRLVTLLSRCDKPKELFSVIPKQQFIQIWPKVRNYWCKMSRESYFRDWWETLYEQLLEDEYKIFKKPQGDSPVLFIKLGKQIKRARVDKGLSQRQLASQIGIKQPNISKIEEGKKNITLFTLMRFCKILNIEKLEMSEGPSKAQK